MPVYIPGRSEWSGTEDDPDATDDATEGTDDFGLTPGSNNWIDGTREFLSDPGQLIRDPYDTAAGAGDAAALNFDEGIGGLVTLVDGREGNTAGPGESPFLERPRVEQPSNPGLPDSDPTYTETPDPDRGDEQVELRQKLKLVGGILLVLVSLYLLRPILEIGAGLVGD